MSQPLNPWISARPETHYASSRTLNFGHHLLNPCVQPFNPAALHNGSSNGQLWVLPFVSGDQYDGQT